MTNKELHNAILKVSFHVQIVTKDDVRLTLAPTKIECTALQNAQTLACGLKPGYYVRCLKFWKNGYGKPMAKEIWRNYNPLEEEMAIV